MLGLVVLGGCAPVALAASPASISSSFGADSVAFGGTTSLSFGIGNPNLGTGLSNIGFSDALPAGLVVASPSNLSNDCGGTASAVAGSSSVTLSGAALAAGTLCSLSLNVTGRWGGKKDNSVTVSSSAGTGNTSTVSLTVDMPPVRSRAYFENVVKQKISFVNLDGTGGGDLNVAGTTVSEPQGIAIDSAGGRIYWANQTAPSIAFANLDGSGAGALNTGAASLLGPLGVAIDPATRRIYWGDYSLNKIGFADLDGSGGGYLLTTGATVDRPFGVALDPAAGRIYWANNMSNSIAFARLDGSGGGTVTTVGATVSSPQAVAVDPAGGRIYWANNGGGIFYARLDGGGAGPVTTTGATVTNPVGIAVDHSGNRLYWANEGADSLSFAGLDGSGGANLSDTPYAAGNSFPALLQSPAAATAPSISGDATVGWPLSCSPGDWAPDIAGSFLFRAPHSFAYQWSLGGVDIAGATASSFTTAAPGDYRCRVTASNVVGSAAQSSAAYGVATPTPAGTPPPGPAAPVPTVPTMSALRETNRTFVAGHGSTPLTGVAARARHRRGTTFSFSLDQAATVKIAIQGTAPGRRVGGTCKPDRPSLRRARRCTRRITVATLTRTGRSGSDKVPFSGRIRGKALKPRRYRAVFTATDSAGGSAPKTLHFTIVRR